MGSKILVPVVVLLGLIAVAVPGSGGAAEPSEQTIGDVHLATDTHGRFAVAWMTADEASIPSEQIHVTLGTIGSKRRVVRTISPPGRQVGEIGIALDGSGRAVVAWSDQPAVEATPPENWLMARVDPAGNVASVGHYAGPYFSDGLLRTSRGSLVAFAERGFQVYASTLRQGAPGFSEPRVIAEMPTANLAATTLVDLKATSKTFATFLWVQERPRPRGFFPTRLVEQRIRFAGGQVGHPQVLSPWGQTFVSTLDGYRGNEAVAWGTQRSVFVSTGRAGHLRKVRLGASTRFAVPQVAFAPSGRLFVVARRDDPGPDVYRPGIDPTPKSDIVAAVVWRRGLRHVLRLDRSEGPQFSGWKVLRGRAKGTDVAMWQRGNRLYATTVAGTHRRRRVSLRVGNLQDYSAAVIDRHHVLVAFAPSGAAVVKIRVLHL